MGSYGNLVIALAIPVVAALGGAAAVLGEIDDAPGLVLIGILLVLVTEAFSVRTARRKA